MSLAINRKKINDLVYFGLGKPMQDPRSSRRVVPAQDEAVVPEYTNFDPEGANKLLDDIGLKLTGTYRTLPDGKPLSIAFLLGRPRGEASGALFSSCRDIGALSASSLHVHEVERSLYLVLTSGNKHDLAMWHADAATDPIWVTNAKLVPVRQRYAAFGPFGGNGSKAMQEDRSHLPRCDRRSMPGPRRGDTGPATSSRRPAERL